MIETPPTLRTTVTRDRRPTPGIDLACAGPIGIAVELPLWRCNSRQLARLRRSNITDATICALTAEDHVPIIRADIRGNLHSAR